MRALYQKSWDCINNGRVERSAPRRVRPPPRQTVRAVFPHTAFHVKLTLSRTPFPHLIQPHCLPFVIIRLRILELIPTLARVLREDDEPISHIFVHPVEPPVGISAQEVVRPPFQNDVEFPNSVTYRYLAHSSECAFLHLCANLLDRLHGWPMP